MCAEDAIIVMAAGNEGLSNCTMVYTFNGDNDSVEFCIEKAGGSDKRGWYGFTDIWSADERPLSIELTIYDYMNDKEFPLLLEAIPQPGEEVYIYGKDYGDEANHVFRKYFNGWLAFAGDVDEENGRYNLQIGYDYTPLNNVLSGVGNYRVGVKIGGEDGMGVDIFADAQYSILMYKPGNPFPGSDMSISDWACGHKVVSVGMYENLDYNPVSSYSSYGILRDGRYLPMTVAPGMVIVSAASRPYVKTHEVDDIPYMWAGGTSMAAPYVAGFIATMLEAFPELTIEQVQEAIKATNHLDDIPYPEDLHNGEGFFDPYDTLQYILKQGSVTGLRADEDSVRILLRDGNVEIVNPTGCDITVEVYSTTGMLHSRQQCEPGINAIGLPQGMWVIKAGSFSEIVRL